MLTSKPNTKHVTAILLSIILLLSTTQFSVAQNNNTAKVQEDQTSKNVDKEEKFESDFYEKLKIMDKEEKEKEKNQGSAYKPREYVTILWIEEPETLEENPDNFVNVVEIKDKLKDVLVKDHKASMVYKGLALPFVSAKLPVTEIERLADYYYVDIIGDGEIEVEQSGLRDGDFSLIGSQPDRFIPIETNLDNARSTVNASNPPNCPDASPCDGSGIKIAVLDTGIFQNHPALEVGSKIVAQTRCALGECVQDGNYAGNNHGTANAGIAAAASSAGDYRGIAPAALILNAKTENSGVIQAIDWAVANDADVITASFTSGDCLDTKVFGSVERAVDKAVEDGVVVVAAIGNSASNAVSRWACAFNVIAVGAINDYGTPQKTDDEWWIGGSSGPTFDGRIKPDLVAPGVLIKTATECPAQAGSYYSDLNYWNKNLNPQACQSTPVSDITGTSHAAPFVAGAAALLLEKNPTWTPAQVKAAIKQAANNALGNFPNILTTNANLRGAGVLDVGGALSITSPDITWAYDFDTATYTVKSKNSAEMPNVVEYKLQKETSNAWGISAVGGKFRENRDSTPPTTIFAHLYVPSIKINNVAKTLDDSKLWSAPRVDIRNKEATTYATYKVDGKKVQLIFTMKNTFAYLQVKFYDTLQSSTYEIVQYSDYDRADASDRVRGTAGGSPIATEKTYTNNKKLYIRDATSGANAFPYIQYDPINFPTEWLVRWHAPDPNPNYNNGENINPYNIVIDYKKSVNGNSDGSPVTLGPKGKIVWSTVVQAEAPGDNEIWIIKDAIPDDQQDFSFTSSTLSNFTLDDDEELSTPSPTPNIQFFTQIQSGTHTITEVLPSGWELIDIACTATGTATYSRQAYGISITLTGVGGVECTFENQPIE